MLPKKPSLVIDEYDGPEAKYSQALDCPLSFVLLSEKNKGLHMPVMCKDFITDAFWSERTKQSVNIYGFTWEPGAIALEQKNFNMPLKYKLADQAKGAKLTRALINLWEKRLGFERSSMRNTTMKTAKVLQFTKEWAEQPIRISLLTLLCRIGTAYKTGETWPEFQDALARDTKNRKLLHPYDAFTLGAAATRITSIWDTKKFPEQTFAQFADQYKVHGSSGIMRFN